MPHGAGPRARPLGTAKDGWEPRGTLTAVTAPRSPRARSGSERRPLPSAAPGWGAACAPIPAYPCPSAAVHSCCGTGLGAALARPPAPPLAPPRRHGVSGAGLGTRGDAGGRVQDHWDMRVPWRPRVGTQRRRMVMETLKRWGQESWGTETRGRGHSELRQRRQRILKVLETHKRSSLIGAGRDLEVTNCGGDVFIGIPEHRSGHEGYCETRVCWW